MHRLNFDIKVIYIIISITLLSSCEKYLQEKPVKSLAVPNTLKDLQALLDNHDKMNEQSSELLQMACDDYYVSKSSFLSSSLDERMNYVWDKNANFGTYWTAVYQGQVYYSNVVLDQLSMINFDENDRAWHDYIKGSALFFRSFAFQNLAQIYCKPYSTTAREDLGIVLRLNSNINDASQRSTVQQTYDQIIGDLKVAADLLPDSTLFATRPNKAAAYALLARVFLSIRDYVNAGKYADLCLKISGNLIDFNNLLPINYPPITRFNKETLFYSHTLPASSIIYDFGGANVDSALYSLYDSNDLRKIIYFYKNSDGSHSFQGSYDGDLYPGVIFDGLATDEIYLIRAESFARAGDLTSALSDLNTLLKTRWSTGTFIPVTASNVNDALVRILSERRKELVFRGLRWSDLRRLNLEGSNITLKRVIDGVTYQLPPADLRWVLLIPQEIIAKTNLPQNPR